LIHQSSQTTRTDTPNLCQDSFRIAYDTGA
jgi:hypothetical protein